MKEDNDFQLISCIERWLKRYRESRPDRTVIGRQADLSMEDLSRQEDELRNQPRRPLVDEEGFTLVVGPKKRTASVKPNASKRKRLSSPYVNVENKPKKKKGRIMDEKLTFYKFERKRLRSKEVHKLQEDFKIARKKAERLKAEMASEN